MLARSEPERTESSLLDGARAPRVVRVATSAFVLAGALIAIAVSAGCSSTSGPSENGTKDAGEATAPLTDAGATIDAAEADATADAESGSSACVRRRR